MEFFLENYSHLILSGSISIMLTTIILVVVDFFKGDSAVADPKYEFLATQVTHLQQEIEEAAKRFREVDEEREAAEKRFAKFSSQVEALVVLHVETQIKNVAQALKQEFQSNVTHQVKKEVNAFESRMSDRTLKMIRGAQNATLTASVEEAAIIVKEMRSKLDELKAASAQASQNFTRHTAETTQLQARLTNGGVAQPSLEAYQQQQQEIIKNSDILLRKMDAEKAVIEHEMRLSHADALAVHAARVASKRLV